MTEIEKVYEIFIDGFSGALGGVVGQLVFYPLENFRVRLQAQDPNESSSSQGILEQFRKLVLQEGIKSFYKGLKMALLATIASYGSYFFLYRMLKNVFTQILKVQALTKRHIALITALAGSTSAAFANPFWFTNTRMAIKNKDGGQRLGVIETVKQIYNEEGVQAFYKGVLPNMILVLNPIINFVLYESIKKRYPQKGFWQIFIASSIGKLFATLVTYPILTVRVKLQASKDGTQSYIRALISLVKQLKLQDLFVGMQAKLVQTILYNAFLMLTYEKMRALIMLLLLKRLAQKK